MIDECDAILNSASDRLSKSTNEAPSVTSVDIASLPGSSKKTEQNEESDSDTVSYDGSDQEEEASCQCITKPPSLVECPLCGNFFPHYAIEVHAGSCGESPYFPSAPVPIVLD